MRHVGFIECARLTVAEAERACIQLMKRCEIGADVPPSYTHAALTASAESRTLRRPRRFASPDDERSTATARIAHDFTIC
jgi:hypothetical protein